MSNVLGKIHSIETCGTVDGPGIRFVVFFQGCPMRCLYCHNPDSWNLSSENLYSVEEILEQYEGVKEFCKGGITVTGGEPLVQIDFLTELFRQAKGKNIHTALDTSGILFDKNNTNKIDELLKYTDLVLLDIKHIDNEEHIKLTKHSNKNVLEFAQYLSENNIPVWIRHVVVPEITYKEEYLTQLGEFLACLKNIKALDVLPYHDMAKSKYKELGLDYQLENIPQLTKDEAINARNIIVKAIKRTKQA
ncbi:MAG: pyruvate formate lyase-activating protein [Cyanobacteria bacterium SIG28]|nr:pyruvate formate lyase-activating protein [Cyanobacteria bacterium SIG28]